MVNSVNSNSIPFKAAEGQQQKTSSGMTFPVLGLAAGGAITGLTKLGKTPLSLESLTTDEFKKSIPTDLAGEEKAAAETIEKYLAKKPATTEAKPEVKADAKPEVKGTAASDATSKENKKKLDDIFGSKKEEIEPQKYLEEKYEYKYKTTADLEAAIKAKKNELSGNPIKGQGANAVNLGKDKKAAASVLSNAESFKKATLEKNRLENQVAEAEAELAKYKADMELRGKTPDTKVIENRQKRIDGIKEELTKADEKIAKIKKQFNPDSLKIEKEAFEAAETRKAKNLKKRLDAAATPGGEITRAEVKARKEALSAVKKVEREKAIIKAKAEGKTSKEIQEAAEAAEKSIKDTDIRVQNAAVRAKEATVDKIGREINTQYVESVTNINEGAAKAKVSKIGKKMSAQQAQIAEMEADLSMIRDAKKNGKNITKTAAGEVLEKAKAAAKAATEAIPDNVAKALEKIKGHLPKKINWAKTGIGAGIGLVAGLIIKGMVDKKPDQVA